jgi:ubiquitin-protein ligase
MSILNKRVWTEFNKLKGLYNDSSIKFLIDSSPFDIEEESTIDFIFIGRIFPTSNPFNQSAFKIEIKLTKLYPAKPPEVRILTPIHHPNVTERGIVCLTILNATESWKPSLFLTDVLKELLIIIDHPNLNIPVNDGLKFFIQ